MSGSGVNKITSCNLAEYPSNFFTMTEQVTEEQKFGELQQAQKRLNTILEILKDQLEPEKLLMSEVEQRFKILEKALLALKEVQTLKQDDKETIKVELEISKQMEFIELEKKKSPSPIQNNGDQLLTEILKKAQETQNKLVEHLSKDKPEMVLVVEVDQGIFHWRNLVNKKDTTQYNLNLLSQKMRTRIEEMRKGQLVGIFKFAQEINLIANMIEIYEADPKVTISILEEIYGTNYIMNLGTGDRSTILLYVNNLFKNLFKIKLSKYNMDAKKYMEELICEHAMRDNERISDWLRRYKTCIRFLKHQYTDKDLVEFFYAGISERWKKQSENKMKDLDLKKAEKLKDIFWDDEDDESSFKKIVIMKNKTNSNYSSQYKNNFSHSSSFINNNKKNEAEQDHSMIFNVLKEKKVNYLENQIKKAQDELEKEKKWKPRKKLYIELCDMRGRKLKFLVDSGSPVHVIRSETVKKYDLPFEPAYYNTYRGAVVDSKVEIIGTSKNQFMNGNDRRYIRFLVADNISEDIISWQKLADIFGEILWFESSKKGRLIAIGRNQYVRDDDGIFRQYRRFDMSKVFKKIDDSKDNQFELENKMFQLSDTTPILNETIKEQRKEIEEMKSKIEELEKPKTIKKPKACEVIMINKPMEQPSEFTIYKQQYSIRKENLSIERIEVEKDFKTEAEEFISNIKHVRENNCIRIEKQQFEEQVKGVKDKFDQFKDQNLEDLLDEKKEEERQKEEFVEEIFENKETAKEELKKMLEEINLIRHVTGAYKKEPFKHKESRDQRKKLEKEQKKKRINEVKEKEEFICQIKELSEDQKEELFEYTRKIAKFDPNKHFQIWKMELEKGMFNKEELYEIWKEMKEENKFPKEKKPWLNQFDEWSDFILRNLQCTDEQKNKFKEGIKKLIDIPQPTFKQTFENNDGIGVDIDMDPKDYIKEPIWYMMQNKVEAARSVIQGWLESGYIEEIDEKDAKCIVNLVIQIKEGKVRVCMDYSKQNKHVKNDYGSFLSVDDVIDRLNPDHKVGFVIDLKGAFHNVLLSDESKKLCCFHFEGKVYCFKVLFFGISCGPFLFNEFLRKRLGDMKDILKYIDDLICTKKTTEELLESFLKLVDLLVKYKIAISPEKMQFGPKLKILGQYWKEGKLQMDINKLIALRYVTVIASRRDLQVNLGMFRFIAKFTEGLNEKLQYFYKKVHEKDWSWTRHDAEKLIKIWLEIESKSVLWTLDPSKEVVLRTDAATKNGIGFSILQYDEYGFERYITHYSKGLSEAQKNYSPIELEAYTIILALDKFYKYFIGHRFRIETDAKSLVNIFNQVAEEKASKKIWRWTYILMQFDFYVVHIRGMDNPVSDWLSKHPVNIEKFYRYLDDLLSKDTDEQLEKINVDNEDLNETKNDPEPSYHKTYNLNETICMLEETIEKSNKILEGKVKEGGDNYMSPTWTLIFIFHNILKKYMDNETYHKHNLEIEKLMNEKDDEKRNKSIYLYILTKVVHDPCPFRMNVKLGSQEDGLNRNNKWGTLNFVNCPYSMELLQKFTERCIEEKKNGNTSVLLISFKYSGYMQKLLFKEPIQWDTLSILPSISFGKDNNGRTFFPAMLLVEFDARKKDSVENSFTIDNLKMRKGIVFRIKRNYKIIGEDNDTINFVQDSKIINEEDDTDDELDLDIFEFDKEERDEMEATEDDEFESEEIDDGVDITKFDGYHPGFNENLDVRFEQENKMFEPKIELEGIDAYESIVRCLLEGKKLPTELAHPKYSLLRKQAEHYLKHHQIINNRLCYVDQKRLDKYNKGVRYYVRVADRYKIFRIAHELNGHLSIEYVMNYAQDYWWPNMYTHIKEKIESCPECQRFKKSRDQQKVINTTPFYEPFQCGHIDLMGKLPGKYKYAFVYNDHCTKYTIAKALKTKNMDKIAEILIRDIFYVVGFIEIFVHDRGSEFVNKLVDAIFKKTGTRVRITSVRHSSANMVERKNKIIGQMIRCLVYDHHENWYKFLPEVVFAMNTYIPKGLWNSPFELTFGRKPWTLLDLVMDNKNKHGDKNINKWYARFKYWVATNKALEWELRKKNQVISTQERFKVGDIVKIAGEDLFYNSGSKKLQPYQSGPYKVLEIKNGSAKLEKIVSDGEKERTITAPTYKLTEYKLPIDNPEMPEPEVIEDYCPREILDEFIDDDGVKKYSVEGIYLGKTDLETWTEDEFLKPENKFLLEEWNKKKEEEKKLEEMNRINFSVRRRVKEILDVELDENGTATFKCILVSQNITEPQMLTEKMMWASKGIVDKFMKKHGYKRGPNATWIKVTPDPNTLPQTQVSKN